jgi:hypothetical protein
MLPCLSLGLQLLDTFTSLVFCVTSWKKNVALLSVGWALSSLCVTAQAVYRVSTTNWMAQFAVEVTNTLWHRIKARVNVFGPKDSHTNEFESSSELVRGQYLVL